ncbi:MAG: alpha/beta fold hydrolase [Rhodothermales bacterium]
MQLYHKRYDHVTLGADGPPLVILHGLLGASGNWHTLSRSRFNEHFTVYAIDQRSHGRSPHDETFDYPTLAEDLLDFLDEHDIETCTLLGHSMGGKTAMFFALEYPERVDQLIVVDIAPKRYDPRHHRLFEALLALDLATIRSRADADAALQASVPDYGERQFLLKNLKSDGQGGYGWLMNLHGLWAAYPNINAAPDLGQTYDGPTLFIRGGQSTYIADDDMDLVTYLFPTAQLVTIPEAGHWVHAMAPQAFADAVIDFAVQV